MDVVRVFASILLLGNVEFVSGNGSGGDVCGDEAGGGGYDVEIIGKDELNSVAALLGVSATHLLQGLTSRTHMVRGQPLKSMSDANMVRIPSRYRYVLKMIFKCRVYFALFAIQVRIEL